jgi:hypothetical protein
MAEGVQFTDIKDDSRYESRTNTVIRERRYTFYIDNHGPFVERVALDNFDAGEIDRRVAALRLHLSTLPR